MYAIRKISLPESTTKIKTSGCFEKFDPVSFRNDIPMAPLYLFEAESDPNNAWAIWKQIFEYVADMYSHAPLKRKRDEGEILPHGLHAN